MDHPTPMIITTSLSLNYYSITLRSWLGVVYCPSFSISWVVSSSRYIHHLVPQMEPTSHNFHIVGLSSIKLLRNTTRWSWNIIEIQLTTLLISNFSIEFFLWVKISILLFYWEKTFKYWKGVSSGYLLGETRT